MAQSTQVTKKTYNDVINKVIHNCRDAFLDEGMDEHTLQDLKRLWVEKLNASKALVDRVSDSEFKLIVILVSEAATNSASICIPKRLWTNIHSSQTSNGSYKSTSTSSTCTYNHEFDFNVTIIWNIISETTSRLSSTKLKSTRSSSSNRSKSPNSTTRRTTTSSYQSTSPNNTPRITTTHAICGQTYTTTAATTPAISSTARGALYTNNVVVTKLYDFREYSKPEQFNSKDHNIINTIKIATSIIIK